MKTKNTFSKLRRTNRAIIDKLNISNKTVCLLIEEISRLNKAIDVKNIVINSLEIKEKELSDKIYSLYDNLADANKMNTDNYNAWLNEHKENSSLIKTNSKLSIGLTVMSFVIVGLVVALIGVWR